MSESFFEKPILNSPYEYPRQHWELDEETGTPTDRILPHRRPAKYITPIPKPKKQKREQLRRVPTRMLLASIKRDIRRTLRASASVRKPKKR